MDYGISWITCLRPVVENTEIASSFPISSASVTWRIRKNKKEENYYFYRYLHNNNYYYYYYYYNNTQANWNAVFCSWGRHRTVGSTLVLEQWAQVLDAL